MRIEQAVILVGGKGSRLGNLSASTPKPLLNVGAQPFLDTLIENIARYGVRNFVLLAGHLAQQISEHYSNWGHERGLTVTTIVEPSEAGTAGALRNASEYLDAEFFLLNGDSIFDFNILDLACLQPDGPWVGKIALRSLPDTSRYGRVRMNGLRISELVERGDALPGLVNGGVYVLTRDVINYIDTGPRSIEREVFPVLANEGLLFGKSYDTFFIDIGIPADFAKAQSAVPSHMTKPAVFLDRDGVLNADLGYVCRAEDFVWQPGALAAVRHLNDAGYYVFVVTNQAGIARGFYTESAMHALHDWMAKELAKVGAHIDAIYFCPHHPDGQGGFAIVCDCRKPAPGMIQDAMRSWPIDAERSFLIGDKESDLMAACAAGIEPILYKGGSLFDLVVKLCPSAAG